MSRFALILALSLAACSKSEPPAPAPSTSTPKSAKNPEAAKKMIAAGAVVVDPQATNIPIEDFAQRLADVDTLTGSDKTKPIVVYCASGNRSGKAKQQLEAAGYTQVVNGGGLDDLR